VAQAIRQHFDGLIRQYFLWYLFFLPIVIARLRLSRGLVAGLLGGWIGAQVWFPRPNTGL